MATRSDGKTCDHTTDNASLRRGKCPKCGTRDLLLTAANTAHNKAHCDCGWDGCQCEVIGRYFPGVPNETGWILREVYGYTGHVDYACTRDAADSGKSHMQWFHSDEPPDIDMIRRIVAGEPIPSGRFKGKTYRQVHG